MSLEEPQILSYTCDNKCCIMHTVSEFTASPLPKGKGSMKAGAFIYDPKEKRVLLVQSRGHLWGPPKGTIEAGESPKICAIREVKEETGLEINRDQLNKFIVINNKAIYFYIEKDFIPVTVQRSEDEEANDANGITWIRLECLEDAVKKGNIILNYHTQFLLKKFLEISLTFASEFTKIERKKKKNYKYKNYTETNQNNS